MVTTAQGRRIGKPKKRVETLEHVNYLFMYLHHIYLLAVEMSVACDTYFFSRGFLLVLVVPGTGGSTGSKHIYIYMDCFVWYQVYLFLSGIISPFFFSKVQKNSPVR